MRRGRRLVDAAGHSTWSPHHAPRRIAWGYKGAPHNVRSSPWRMPIQTAKLLAAMQRFNETGDLAAYEADVAAAKGGP